jgi:ABC-type transporter Mla subunit MlaD
MATMGDKFQADPERSKLAMEKLDALADRINGIGERFQDRLSDSREVLGHDPFGLATGEQLDKQKSDTHEVLLALAHVAKSFPEALRANHRYAANSQQKVIDAIGQYHGYQGAGLPGKGGVTGR